MLPYVVLLIRPPKPNWYIMNNEISWQELKAIASWCAQRVNRHFVQTMSAQGVSTSFKNPSWTSE